MKQTAIQQAIAMVRNRIESIDETLMGKHTAHHLQQVERELYELIDAEKEQIKDAYRFPNTLVDMSSEQYYNETFNTKEKCLSCGNEKQDYVLYCEFCRQEI
jgi:hypothetical protein